MAAGHMRSLWEHHRFLFIATCVMSLLTLVLAIRLLVFSAYWATHREMPVEAWMPMGYIARSHGIPVEIVREAAGLPADVRDRRSLEEIALDKGIAPQQLADRIRRALTEYGNKQEPATGNDR